MSLVDSLKRLRATLVEATMPQRVVFHHVPKCGGTSVGRALRKRYLLSQATILPEESYRAFEAVTGRTDREQMLVDVLALREQMLLYLLFQDVRCISVHVPFSLTAHRVFAARYKFITVLREPVSRFISHYFWSFGKPVAHGHIQEDFASFLRTPRARRMGASYVKYFCGQPGRPDLDSSNAIQSAIDNLKAHFSVIGFTDRLPQLQQHIHRELGARVRIGHENRARQPEELRTQIITPELRSAAATLCEPDLAVWAAARALNFLPERP